MNDVPIQFESFVGKEVKVNEFAIGTTGYSVITYDVDPNDVTVQKINIEAINAKLEVMFRFPETVYADNYVFARINFHIEKNAFGYKISEVTMG